MWMYVLFYTTFDVRNLLFYARCSSEMAIKKVGKTPSLGLMLLPPQLDNQSDIL